MVPTAPGVIVDGEEHEMEPYVPMENADDPGGLRLPGDAAEVPGVGVEGADAEVEEPEELEEDDPHVPGRQDKLKTQADALAEEPVLRLVSAGQDEGEVLSAWGFQAKCGKMVRASHL